MTETAEQCQHIPVPDAVSRLRTDRLGRPVPVVVPWADDQPSFAHVSSSRIMLVAAHQLCGVCGLALEPGEDYWVPGDADNEDLYSVLQSVAGLDVNITGRTGNEPGGHRECIVFAAMRCPYLARDSTSLKGVRRGQRAMLFAHDSYRYELSAQVLGRFHYGPLRDTITYANGRDLAAELVAAIAAAPARKPAAGLGFDLNHATLNEEVWDSAALALLHTPAGRRPAKQPRNSPCACGGGRKAKHCCQ